MDDITIFRSAKDRENPYTMIRRDIAEDQTISWAAKGLMLYLLSRPDDWRVHLNDLRNRSTNGICSVRNIVDELIEHGYLHRNKTHNELGHFEWHYLVYEVPTTSGFLHMDRPDMEDLPSTDTNLTDKEPTYTAEAAAGETPLVEQEEEPPREEEISGTLPNTSDEQQESVEVTPDGGSIYCPLCDYVSEWPEREQDRRQPENLTCAGCEVKFIVNTTKSYSAQEVTYRHPDLEDKPKRPLPQKGAPVSPKARKPRETRKPAAAPSFPLVDEFCRLCDPPLDPNQVVGKTRIVWNAEILKAGGDLTVGELLDYMKRMDPIEGLDSPYRIRFGNALTTLRAAKERPRVLSSTDAFRDQPDSVHRFVVKM